MGEQIRSYGQDPNKLKHQYLMVVRKDFEREVQKFARDRNISLASVYRMGAKKLLQENGYFVKDEW